MIIANLLVYKQYEFNDCLLLINSIFNEFYIELQLRYDRLICLPSQILYEEVFNSNEIIIIEEVSIDENKPSLNAWNHNSIQSINGLKFNDWPIDCYYNLDCILHRFNGCILKGILFLGIFCLVNCCFLLHINVNVLVMYKISSIMNIMTLYRLLFSTT